MSDMIKPEDYTKAFYIDQNEACEGRIKELEAEAEINHKLIGRQRDLLTGVANALRGEPGELELHSHHDLPERAATLKEKYNDLIMQVAMKHPDETRHETAKRYIYNAEHQDNPPAAALEQEKGK